VALPGAPDPRDHSTGDPDRTAPIDGGSRHAIPSRVGHYQIQRAIGAGSFGTVYEAIQDSPRRLVALKLLRPTSEDSERFRRFRVEAEVLGRLRHPGIAQVFEAGVHAGAGLAPGMVLPFIAMELLSGARTLTDFCDARTPDRAARIGLMIQVCHAVEHAHAHNVVHRDLKPSNILVEERRDAPPVAKVIDFGVARWIDPHASDLPTGTAPDQLVGTVAYMSPEQCSGAEITQHADQYALGVVLFQLLTGRLPHKLEGTPLIDATRVIRDDPPLRPSSLDASLAGDLETIILKALEKEPARRYPSVAELRADLERWLAGAPIVARSASAAYVVSRRISLAMHAQRGLAAAIVLALGLLVSNIFSALALRPGTALQRASAALLARAAPASQPAIENLPDVRVIGFSDATDMAALARTLNIPGVDNAIPKTFRALHGALMKHLAGSGVRVVIFDIAFAGEPNGMEPAFAQGVAALKAAAVETVVVMPTWHIDEGGRILLDPTIAASGVRFGITTGNFHSTDLWAADAYMRRAGLEAVPGLMVAAYAAWRAPGVPARFTPLDNALEIGYSSPAAAPYWLSASSRDPDVLPLSGSAIVREPIPELGVQSGDAYGQYLAFVPPEPRLTPAVLDYAAVLSTPREQLRAKLGGKAIIVANLRSTDDRKARPNSDQTISGALVNAALLQNLLSGRIYAPPAPAAQILLGAGPAALALCLLWRSGRAAAIATTLVLACLTVALSLALYRWDATVWNPIPAVIALAVTVLLFSRIRRDRSPFRSATGTTP
jgi:hypothetical protein